MFNLEKAIAAINKRKPLTTQDFLAFEHLPRNLKDTQD